MNLVDALGIVARNALNHAYDDWVEDGWEQIPDIGEVDFQRVVGAMTMLVPVRPSIPEYDAAMKFLEDRAETIG